MERAKGFEPSTPTLARLCSTPELHPRPERPLYTGPRKDGKRQTARPAIASGSPSRAQVAIGRVPAPAHFIWLKAPEDVYHIMIQFEI